MTSRITQTPTFTLHIQQPQNLVLDEYSIAYIFESSV